MRRRFLEERDAHKRIVGPVSMKHGHAMYGTRSVGLEEYQPLSAEEERVIDSMLANEDRSAMWGKNEGMSN